MNEFEWHLLEDKPPAEQRSLGRRGVQARRPRVAPPSARRRHYGHGSRRKDGVIEAIEQNYEGDFQLAIVLDDDPGRDLGMMRQPGHRFFFAPEEVDLLP